MSGQKEILISEKYYHLPAERKKVVTMRAGGTSLAGQVVSSGIIVDISRYMNKIIEINREERWVKG